MSRYSFQDSIRDKATLPLHFEAPTVKLKINQAAIDEAYKQITGNLSEQDRDDLAKRAAKMAVLVKNPERMRAVVEHIVKHYQTKVEPNGFKAQVVCFDRECCVLYKNVIDTLVLDADVLDAILKDANPDKKAREVEIKLIARLRKHAGNPKFKQLGERLEKIREKHEQGLLNSLEFLKAILEIARDTVEAEKQTDPQEEKDQALAALTELFNEVKTRNTHVIVERIVVDIDAIVKQVRFDGWQTTTQGEREVQQALRRALLKYKLHTDQELFDKAYGYIRQYY